MASSDRPLPPAEPDVLDDLPAGELPSEPVDGEVEGVLIQGDGLSGRDARGIAVTDSVLVDVDLSNTVLARARFLDVTLREGATANANLDEADLRRVRLERVRMTGAVLAGSHLEDVTFEESRLDLCNLRFATLERVRFEGCRMHDADLQGIRCTSVLFDRCDLTAVSWSGATFDRTELRGCDLAGASGLESLRGVGIPWDDIVRSMAEITQAAGIRVVD